MVKVPVNRIIPFSSVDGPGSRTAVFLQGCNINCRYCHNPETRKLCRAPLCTADCVAACKTHALERLADGRVVYHPEKCVFCDCCIRTCAFDSSPRIRWMNAAEVFAEVMRQVPFIRGVTVSGGECTLYPDFLTEFFSLCREKGLHTLIDSNGMIPFSAFSRLLAVTDGVMLDIKAYDSGQHRQATGADNGAILDNAAFLAGQGKLYEIRTVVVPGLFDAEDTVRKSVRLLASCSYQGVSALETVRYKLIAYRENGVRKQYRLYQSPDRAQMESLAEAARQEGIKQVMTV